MAKFCCECGTPLTGRFCQECGRNNSQPAITVASQQVLHESRHKPNGTVACLPSDSYLGKADLSFDMARNFSHAKLDDNDIERFDRLGSQMQMQKLYAFESRKDKIVRLDRDQVLQHAAALVRSWKYEGSPFKAASILHTSINEGVQKVGPGDRPGTGIVGTIASRASLLKSLQEAGVPVLASLLFPDQKIDCVQ